MGEGRQGMYLSAGDVVCEALQAGRIGRALVARSERIAAHVAFSKKQERMPAAIPTLAHVRVFGIAAVAAAAHNHNVAPTPTVPRTPPWTARLPLEYDARLPVSSACQQGGSSK